MNKLPELFNEFPMLEIGDYTLRRIELTDAHDIYDIYSDIEVMKYQGESPIPAMEQITEFIEFIDSGFNKKFFIRWCISDKVTNKVIGLISFHHIDYKNNNGQIGYILNRLYWGKKLMSTLVLETIRYLFTNLDVHKLEVSIHPENISSIKLAEKVGFIDEGLRKDCIYNDYKEQYESRVIMGLINALKE